MKKWLIIPLLCIALAGCGKSEDIEMNETTSTEETSFEEDFDSEIDYDSVITEQTTDKTDSKSDNKNVIYPNSDDSSDKSNDKDGRDDNLDNPELKKESPVDNVNNTLFTEVSNAVRNNCNSGNNANVSSLKSDWSKMIKTKEERVYADTAANLISAYARLNNCRKQVYDNNDVVTDEDIEALTAIEDGLSTNVEIFLNADTTSVMDGNFDYNSELSSLESSLNSKIQNN